MEFDAKRAQLAGKEVFKPFRPNDNGVPIEDTNLKPGTKLVVFERGAERRALLFKEMVYHHVAQGELDGEPYVVTF
ncbi:MAG: DUF3179 domain-containing protein [Proteobacteria bacterium]|nr:DUF3179 domain-containing protein [Pseudomonadota bacterium]